MEMIMRSYPNGWVGDSIMHRRGVGGGSSGVTHYLSEDVQGVFHYTIGPYSKPVLHINPGDRVVVETRDAFEGKLKRESDIPSKILEMPWLNPQCGPIMVEGAEKGDVLAVHIEEMAPRGEQPRGTCCLIKEFGALTGTIYTATLNEPLPEIVRKIRLDEKHVYWSDRVTLPYKPHIGTLSCSPEIDSINSLTPDMHGGNMDLPDMGPGTITYLPVRSPGGRLFIGDAHACQGDGEVCGVAVEYPTTTTITVDLIKDWPIEWPPAGGGRLHHGNRLDPAARGQRAHRLSGTHPLDGRRLRVREVGRLHDAQPVRQGAPRQLRGPQVHRRRRGSEEVSRLRSAANADRGRPIRRKM